MRALYNIMTLEKIFKIARNGIDEIPSIVDGMKDEDIIECLILLKQSIQHTKLKRKKDLIECIKEIHCMVK